MPGIRRTPWGTNIPIERRVAAERETNGFQRHFESEIERRRVDPQDDLLTNLLNATLDEPGVDPRVSSEWSRSRCDSPVRRKACSASPPRDIELAGVMVPEGARLVLVYGAANRDEIVYPDAETFDPDRPRLKEHLAFGKGIHFCLGAALSRLEARVALGLRQRKSDSHRFDHGRGVSPIARR